MNISSQKDLETNSSHDSSQPHKIFKSGRLATVVVKESFFKKKKKIMQ